MNKRHIVLALALLLVGNLFSQTTYFKDSSKITSSDGKYTASLYSVTIDDDYTFATIELIPLEDLAYLPVYTGSKGTHVKLGEFKLPLLGLYDGEDFKLCDYSAHLSFSDVKQGQSYRYTLGFDGHIPAGYTDFTLDDTEDTDHHGFSFRGYKLNNPSINASSFTKTSMKTNILGNDDGVCGIYEYAKGENMVNVACVKNNGKYQVVLVDCSWPFPWWHEGDIIGRLRETATPGLFKAEWYDLFKLITNEPMLLFDGVMMSVDVGDDEPMHFIKMYPTVGDKSDNFPSLSGRHQKGIQPGDVITINAGEGTPLFVEPSSSAKVLHTLHGLVQITVVKVDQMFSVVKADGYEGFISNRFLQQ